MNKHLKKKDNMINNVKNGKVTTFLGCILILVSVLFYVAPMFNEEVLEPEWYVPLIMGAVGLLLLLSPDTLVGILKKKGESV